MAGLPQNNMDLLAPMSSDIGNTDMPKDNEDIKIEARPVPRFTESDAKEFKERLISAEKYEEKNFRPKYERSWNLYKGKHYAGELPEEWNEEIRPIVIHYLIHFVETLIDSVVYDNAELVLKPVTRSAQEYVTDLRHVLEYYWRKGMVQDELRLIAEDWIGGGLGIGWMNWLQVLPDKEAYIGYKDESKSSEALEYRPILRRIDPRHFLIDPCCGQDPQEAEFLGWIEYVRVEDVKARKVQGYKRLGQLKGSSKPYEGFLSDKWRKVDEALRPDDVKWVKLYHGYSKRRRIHVVFSEEVEREHFVEYWTWEHNYYPFITLASHRSPSDFYGQSLPELLESLIWEWEDTRLQAARARRKLINKPIIHGKTAPDEKQISDIEDPDGVLYLKPDQQMIDYKPGSPDPFFFNMYGVFEHDAQLIAGFSPYQTISPPTKRVAGSVEVQAIERGSGARLARMRSQFEKAAAFVLRIFVDLVKQYMDEELEIPFEVDGQVDFTTFRGRDLRDRKAEYDCIVNVAPDDPPGNQDGTKALADLFGALGQFAPVVQALTQGGIQTDIPRLLNDIMSSIPGLPEDGKYFSVAPPPIQSMPGGQTPLALPPGNIPPEMGGMGSIENGINPTGTP